ncbi:MAG: DNA modification methylase [Planctomycetaceae bacterium]|nr:DNA modification methylase [Planctomycetaceae bacterium]
MLAEIGYADALIARELKDGSLELIDGHLRADETPNEKVPVLVLDVTAQEADILLATLDPLAAMAGRDDAAFARLVEGADAKSQEVRDLLEGLSAQAILEPEPLTDDEPLEPPKKPVTRRGDLWKLGRHRLLCGDSRQAGEVARVLKGITPRLMVTDPPYGVEYDPAWRQRALPKNPPRRVAKILNDDEASWRETYSHFTGDIVYVWHAGIHADTVAGDLVDAGFDIRTQIIWRKQHFVLSRGHYHWQHEPCWYGVRRGRPSHWCGDRRQSTVWDIANQCSAGGQEEDITSAHSTQKPVECMGRPLRHHGAKGDWVYDPFVGSGSTLSAAEQLERHCAAIELDPGWCDVVIDRWEKLSGQKATRERRC